MSILRCQRRYLPPIVSNATLSDAEDWKSDRKMAKCVNNCSRLITKNHLAVTRRSAGDYKWFRVSPIEWSEMVGLGETSEVTSSTCRRCYILKRKGARFVNILEVRAGDIDTFCGIAVDGSEEAENAFFGITID